MPIMESIGKRAIERMPRMLVPRLAICQMEGIGDVGNMPSAFWAISLPFAFPLRRRSDNNSKWKYRRNWNGFGRHQMPYSGILYHQLKCQKE
jgi:hypothetical protein